MDKYDFIQDIINLFDKMEGMSKSEKKHNLDRYVEYFLLNFKDIEKYTKR